MGVTESLAIRVLRVLVGGPARRDRPAVHRRCHDRVTLEPRLEEDARRNQRRRERAPDLLAVVAELRVA